MKKYQKPNVDIKALQLNESISSLATWLENNAEYKDAVITTFAFES